MAVMSSAMKWIEVEKEGWEAARSAVARPALELEPDLLQRVAGLISRVRESGDATLLELGRQFDCPSLSSLQVSDEEWEAGCASVDEAVAQALQQAADQIAAFHRIQLRPSWMHWTDYGNLGQLVQPLARVGIYVPGGRAPYPSTVLMCAIPAAVAGVPEIYVCTPAGRDGTVHPAVLYAARLAGVRAVFKVGGAQAVAAMAYGTETIPAVDKIVGPGNLYVCAAKRLLWGVTDMDMIAGPSEVCVVADSSANPAYVAADLLTQAEHDPECAVFLLTPDRSLAELVQEAITIQLSHLTRADICREAMEKNGVCVVTRTLEEAMELANACAPEHLALHVQDPWTAVKQVRNAGAVMLGPWTPQTAGDYMAGPSHTLPTGGTARFWSPVNVETFYKRTSLIQMDEAGLKRLADSLTTLATAEGFQAHANAVRIRLSSD